MCHSQQVIDAVNDLQISQMQIVVVSLQAPGTPEEVEAVLGSQAAVRDPLSASWIRFLSCIPRAATGDLAFFSGVSWKRSVALYQAATANPELTMRHKCALQVVHAYCLDCTILEPAFEGDALFGVGGAMLKETVQRYSYDRDHSYLVATNNGDLFCHVKTTPRHTHKKNPPRCVMP